MSSTSPPPAAPSLLGRLLAPLRRLAGVGLWLVANPLIAFPFGALLLLGIIGGGYAATRVIFPVSVPLEAQLALALEKLDVENFDSARRLAGEMAARKDLSYEEMGGPMFVLGAAMMHDAEERPEARKQQVLYRVAARYLEEARDRGFPVGREAEGIRRLAESLHRAGRFAQAAPLLRQAIELNSGEASALRWLLAEAYWKSQPPDLLRAGEAIESYLRDEALPLFEQQAGQLRLGEIYLASGELDACRQTLARLPDESSLKGEGLILETKAYLQEADGATDTEVASSKLHLALAAAERIPALPDADEALGKAEYLIGLCKLRLGDLRGAEKQFLSVRQNHFGGDEAFAATVHAIEIAHREKRTGETLALAEKLFAEAPLSEEYANEWLPLSDLQRRFGTLAAEMINRGDYEEAISLSELMSLLVPETDSLLLRAKAHLAAAHQLRLESVKQPFVQSGVSLATAREHERQAGDDYGRLAKLRYTTKHYEDDLWNSASSLLAGHAYGAAAKRFRAMLAQEIRYRRPEVLLGLGESLLALGQPAEASAILQQCLEQFAKNPASYKARLIAAKAESELGHIDRAKELLNDNLYSYSLTPESSEWRDSLFALGRFLMQEGMELETKSRLAGVDHQDPMEIQAGLAILDEANAAFEEAAKVLTEAVRRFPEASETLLARYKIAEAHRQAAKLPRKKLAVTTIETTRVQLNRQIQQELGLALDEYGKLLAQLDQEQTTQQRNPLELTLVRNCYFERADVLFDLGRFEEALMAYSAASNRYQAEPESLEAYVQIAACYRRLNKGSEARGTLEQARVVLKRIRSDADFTRTTRYNRDEWGNLLAWLASL